MEGRGIQLEIKEKVDANTVQKLIDIKIEN